MIKTIFLVRHGQTGANKKHIHQGPDEILSDHGREQALEVTDILRDLKIDTLTCSSMVRARETAEIIGMALGMPHTIIPDAVEVRRPDSVYGKRHFSYHSIKYALNLYRCQSNPEWSDEGGENLFDVHNRIRTTQDILSELPGERIALVSHAIFIDMFIKMVCLNRDLTMKEFVNAALAIKKLPNTGVVSFTVQTDPVANTCAWNFHGYGKEVAKNL